MKRIPPVREGLYGLVNLFRIFPGPDRRIQSGWGHTRGKGVFKRCHTVDNKTVPTGATHRPNPVIRFLPRKTRAPGRVVGGEWQVGFQYGFFEVCPWDVPRQGLVLGIASADWFHPPWGLVTLPLVLPNLSFDHCSQGGGISRKSYARRKQRGIPHEEPLTQAPDRGKHHQAYVTSRLPLQMSFFFM